MDKLEMRHTLLAAKARKKTELGRHCQRRRHVAGVGRLCLLRHEQRQRRYRS